VTKSVLRLLARPQSIRAYVFPAILLLLVSQLAAQSRPPVVFELGLRAGVPFHSALATQFRGYAAQYSLQNLERAKFVAGPTISAILYDRLQIEFGALYKPVRFQIDTVYQGSCANPPMCTTTNPGLMVLESGRGHFWEFPLNANYYFGERRFRPYFGGGIVLSQELGFREDLVYNDQATGIVTRRSGSTGGVNPAWPSIIVDAGLEWSRGPFRLRPELRYTRHRGEGFSSLRSDQVDFLIGFSFARWRGWP